jgi:hypothetical protein
LRLTQGRLQRKGLQRKSRVNRSVICEELQRKARSIRCKRVDAPTLQKIVGRLSEGDDGKANRVDRLLTL